MLPELLLNVGHVHEYLTQILKYYGSTFEFKGPWFTGMEIVLTSDPANVHHILSKNFSNYGKGTEFQEILEPLGDGILRDDSDSWAYQRKMMQLLIKNNKFELFLEKVVRQKVVNGLIPVLDRFSRLQIEVDLQDVFNRLAFDNTCVMILGFDPSSLSVELPKKAPYEMAFEEMEKAALQRHIVPKWCWKLKRWLQIGEEKKLSKAFEIFDRFIYQCISSKREELCRRHGQNATQVEVADEADDFNLLTTFMKQEEKEGFTFSKSDKFLRDAAFNFMGAGRNTIGAALAWFFWLVATNPSVETKILEEIKENLMGEKEVNKQVYLHAAICEALRLYPAVPFDPKAAIEPDILPSGHHVNRNTRIMLSFYTMGRMEEIWGEDCLEYKPERWVSERGEIIHVPTYKFTAFSAGPRTCVGKSIALIQMKIIATAIMWNYHVQVVESHPVSPSGSVSLPMKHGLKVKVIKRSI